MTDVALTTSRSALASRFLWCAVVCGALLMPNSAVAQAPPGLTIDQQVKLLDIKLKAPDPQLKIVQAKNATNASNIKGFLDKLYADVQVIKDRVERILG
jgi:hypothetical protein